MQCDMFCEDLTSFPGIIYLITTLISSFFKKEIEKLFFYFCLRKLIYFLNNKISLPIDNLSTYFSKLQFAYFGLLAWCRTVQRQLFSGFNTLRQLELLGFCPLDPTQEITPCPTQCPMDPSYVGSALQVLAKQ